MEGTAPPCVFQTFAHPTSPYSVCRILQLPDCLTEQAGGEVGWANVWKTQGGAVPSVTDIYSLVQTLDREERWVIFLFVLTEFYKFTVLHGFELTSFRFEIKKKK